MQDGIQTLTIREVEVLRMLLGGHCAKSIAQRLDLSVHAVNERLRHARRKLSVSSSREAARLLAEAEALQPNLFVDTNNQPPNFSVDKNAGLPPHAAQLQAPIVERREGSQFSLTPLTGGVLVMALLVASLIFSNMLGNSGPAAAEQVQPQAASVAAAVNVPQALADDQAVDAMLASDDTSLAPASQTPIRVEIDLMPVADTNGDGIVGPQEYRIFSEQGWNHVSAGDAQVVVTELNGMQRMAFVGIMPNAHGIITRQMYLSAIPARFRLLDQNGDNVLSADELNGRHFQGQAPPPA